jgi:protein kinase A
LQRKPANRLGLNGPSEVKAHVWWKDFDWEHLLTKIIKSPYIPDGGADNFDAK